LVGSADQVATLSLVLVNYCLNREHHLWGALYLIDKRTFVAELFE
jgi:hypothetical protein